LDTVTGGDATHATVCRLDVDTELHISPFPLIMDSKSSTSISTSPNEVAQQSATSNEEPRQSTIPNEVSQQSAIADIVKTKKSSFVDLIISYQIVEDFLEFTRGQAVYSTPCFAFIQGPHGSGKTALVDYLAHSVLDGRRKTSLLNFYSLTLYELC
jgi:hypothetical protein